MYAKMMKMGRNVIIVSIDLTVNSLLVGNKTESREKSNKLIFLSSLEAE